MYADETLLSEFLLDSGLVTRSQLAGVRVRAAESGLPFSRVLIDAGMLSEDEVRRVMAKGLGIPFVTLTQATVALDALALIPEPFARAHNAIGMQIQGDMFEVALLDLATLEELDLLPNIATYTIVPRLTDRASMMGMLLHYQKHLKTNFGERLAREAAAVLPPQGTTQKELLHAAERVSVAHVVDALIGHALYQSAHAIHLRANPQGSGLLVQYRIGKTLYDAMTLPLAAAQSVLLRLKFLAQLSLTATVPQEGRFKVEIDGEQVALRVSVMPFVNAGTVSEKIVVHIAHDRTGKKGFSLESVGLHGRGLEQIHKALASQAGIILVAGQPKSGKTTLLYTLLDYFGGLRRSVATIEERVEVEFPFAVQTQTAPEAGLTMASGLRALLRQDPDVVMVSSINDRETAALVVEAANRGVLVLASVEAASATEGIEKLLAFDVSPFMLASALKVSIGTRLVRRLCVNHDPHRLARIEANRLEANADLGAVLQALKTDGHCVEDALWKDVTFFRAESCSLCRGGYSGFVGLQEVLPVSLAMKDHIRAVSPDMALQAKEEGVLTFVEEGLYKAAQGLTSVEEVLALVGKE